MNAADTETNTYVPIEDNKKLINSNLKNHPFYVEVDEYRTLEEQIQYNVVKNKEILKVWSQLDGYLCQADTSETFPVGQFIFNLAWGKGFEKLKVCGRL